MGTEQAPVPVQALLQPANADPAGIALVLSATEVPCTNGALQVPDNTPAVEVQLMPAGLLVTVPVPAPEPVIERVN
jgi:hypothetical protein